MVTFEDMTAALRLQGVDTACVLGGDTHLCIGLAFPDEFRKNGPFAKRIASVEVPLSSVVDAQSIAVGLKAFLKAVEDDHHGAREGAG